MTMFQDHLYLINICYFSVPSNPLFLCERKNSANKNYCSFSCSSHNIIITKASYSSFLLYFQFGLHQMRASKDEGKPEPHTLIKFGNPYFRDAGGLVRNQGYHIYL